MSIQIQVRNKIAVNLTPEKVIVCGNSGYELEFLFDEEWESEEVKTARFVYRKGGQNYFDDVVFTGTTVNAPVLSGITSVLVGVYAGDLITSTPAVVECDKSILCGSGTHKDPQPDVYNQIIKIINSMAGGGGGSTLRVAEILLRASKWLGEDNLYWQAVPIDGVTPYSQVDLNPSVYQLAIFHDKDLSFVTENEGGVVTVYAIGQKPENDYTMQVTIKEVSV